MEIHEKCKGKWSEKQLRSTGERRWKDSKEEKVSRDEGEDGAASLSSSSKLNKGLQVNRQWIGRPIFNQFPIHFQPIVIHSSLHSSLL